MKILRPSPIKQKYWKGVERQIQKIFDEVYQDLFKLTKKEQELYNDVNAIVSAILNQQIGFDDGSFFGQFNSTLTKELRSIGAKYDKTSKTWKLPSKELPQNIQMAVVQRQAMDASLNNKALAIIDNIDINKIITDNGLNNIYERTITSMSSDIDKTIGIKVTMTETQRNIIADEWSENLDLYIKGFLDDNVSELRELVYDNTERGQRAENLVKSIESRYSVTKSKAKFLARQETSLLMSKMRETRYKDAGIQKYKWSTSNDVRVRPRHKDLDGEVFFWDSPPIVDNKGNRKHPGEDFNCRCLAIPIIE